MKIFNQKSIQLSSNYTEWGISFKAQIYRAGFLQGPKLP
jgi:hypothetical protein